MAPQPVKLEFKTTEFPTIPLRPGLRERLEKAAQPARRGKALSLTPDQKLNLARARSNAALLAKKAKARKFTRRVELVRRSKQRKTQSLLARMEESQMEATLRRFSLRRAQMERLGSQHEKVDRVSLQKIEKDLTGRLEDSRKFEKKLEAAAARREALEAKRLQFPARDLERQRSIQSVQEQQRVQRMDSLSAKLQRAQDNRQSLMRKRVSPRRISGGASFQPMEM